MQTPTCERDLAGRPAPLRILLASVPPFLLAFAVFAVSLGGEFHWDDFLLLRSALHLGPDLRSHLFSARLPVEGYRPLLTWSLALNHALGGTDPVGYHLVNCLLHAFAAALIPWSLGRFVLRERAAILAALLFAVHAVHVEVVASVGQRSGALGTVLLVAAWGFHLRGGLGAYLAAGSAFFVGLFAWEGTAVLPAVLLLSDRVIGRMEGRAGSVRALLRAAGYLPALVVYVVLRQTRLGSMIGGQATYFHDQSWLVVALTEACFFVEHYVPGLLFGLGLAPDYTPPSFPDASPGDAWAWACAAGAVAGAAGALAACWRRRSAAALGFLFALLALLPVLNLLFRFYALGAERYAYLPSLGVCLAAGALVDRGLGAARPGLRRVTAVLFGLALLLHAALAAQGAWTWNEPLRANEWFLRQAPTNPLFHVGRGLALARRGRLAEAGACFEQALALSPRNGLALANLADLALLAAERRRGLGDTAGALEALARAEGLHRGVAVEFPGAPGAVGWEGLADVSCLAGVLAPARREEHWEEALRRSEEALRRNPLAARALEVKGRILAFRGRHEEALPWYERAVGVDPSPSSRWFGLGMVLRRLGRMPEAESALRTAVARDRRFPEAWVALGLTLEDEDRPEEAVAAWREAVAARVEGEPAPVAALQNLGRVLLGRLGRPDEALAAFRAVRAVAPSLLEARLQAAAALELLGLRAEGAAELRRFLEEAAGRPEYEAMRAEAQGQLERLEGGPK
ncbi:MAG: tetratricopeptide repeat protein [Planctomycetes bacterium]|nr:tetratricopeptide repeat protein [Planctomycetota bacterium]